MRDYGLAPDEEFEMSKPKPLPEWSAPKVWSFIETVVNAGLPRGMLNFEMNGKKVTLVVHIGEGR